MSTQQKNQAVTTKQPTVMGLVLASKEQFEKALPAHFPVDKFLRIAMTCLRNNEKLAACEQTSLLAALMQSAQLGLSPDPLIGQAYLIPRKRRFKDAEGKWHDRWECNFQIGAKGARLLVQNTGEVQSILTLPVYEEDSIKESYRFGEGGIIFEPALDGKREVLKGVYCLVRFKNGEAPVERFIRIADIYKRRANSDAYKYAAKALEQYNALPEKEKASKDGQKLLSDYQETPWVKWEAEMVEKTAIKMICGDLPIDVERLSDIRSAFNKDEGLTIDADFKNVVADPALQAPSSPPDTPEKPIVDVTTKPVQADPLAIFEDEPRLDLGDEKSPAPEPETTA